MAVDQKCLAALPGRNGVTLMLVLTRKVGEKITIGDDVTIVVSRISGTRVALAIEAPRNMKVLRGELQPFARAPDGAEGKERPVGSSALAPPVAAPEHVPHSTPMPHHPR